MNRLSVFLLMCFIFFAFSSSTLLKAQENDLFLQLEEEEQRAIEALALYPPETRLAILEISLYPEALIKLQRIQHNTSTAFKELTEPLPRNVQQMIWDLSRYPNLTHQLVLALEESDRSIRSILEEYPNVIHDRATEAYQNYPRLLEQADDISNSAEQAFQQVIRTYSENVQKHFYELLALPEVLDLLSQNIQLTILVGDKYRHEPDRVLRQIDSLNLVVVRENAQELEDWQQELEQNPELAEDLQAAVETYADEYDYDDEYYTPDLDDDMYTDPRAGSVVVHHYYHYPFWLGYPDWYGYPCWRPYSYWYPWRRSRWMSQTIVFIHLPSYHFTHWYFHHPAHHIWWPHLSGHFVNHHHRHPRHRSGVVTGVTVWRKNNREVITDGWITEATRNPDRFREYGEFEHNRQRYNQRNPEQQMSPGEYLDQNPRPYPALKQTQTQTERRPDSQLRPTSPSSSIRPEVRLPERAQPQTPPATDNGAERHRNIWERSRKEPVITPKPSTERIQRRPRTSPPTITPRTRKQPTTSARPKVQTPRTRKKDG